MVLFEKLRAIRIKLCISMRGLARIMKVSPNAVSYYESGVNVPAYKTRLEYLELAKKTSIELVPEDFDIKDNRSRNTKTKRSKPKKRNAI